MRRTRDKRGQPVRPHNVSRENFEEFGHSVHVTGDNCCAIHNNYYDKWALTPFIPSFLARIESRSVICN